MRKNEMEQQQLLEGIDALITNLPDYCLAVSTADCVPILLYDKKQKVVAAIHAGWRGTVLDIVTLTLEKMRLLYATQGDDVIACIGPSISKEAFEVGYEVYQEFMQAGFPMKHIASFKVNTQKYHIDLWEANKQKLLAFGIPVSQIQISGICTYQNHHDFFSARRLGIASGRILSGIMLFE